MRTPPIRPVLLTLALLPGGPARGQEIVDQGALRIMRGDTVIGREEFVVRRAGGPGATAFTVSSVVSYPADAPLRTLAALIEYGPDSQPVAAQFDAEGDGGRRVVIRFGERRTTVRIVTPTGESGREYPGTAWHVVLDDSVFGAYAVMPPLPPGPIPAISLRGARRPGAALVDEGVRRTSLGTEEQSLRQISLGVGDDTRHLWYDARGRLMKVAVPAHGIVAIRVRPGR